MITLQRVPAAPPVGLDLALTPASVSPALVFAALLGACVWIGGFVMLVVVVGVARQHLPLDAQVSFFRALGRRYLPVGGLSLALALAAGCALLSTHRWDATALAAVIVAAVLILALIAGVIQARGMTRLRRRHLDAPDDRGLASRIHREAVAAGILRALIGALSVALLVLAAILA